jgi:hypothetical protein
MGMYGLGKGATQEQGLVEWGWVVRDLQELVMLVSSFYHLKIVIDM